MAAHQTSYGELLAMPIDELRKDILMQRALVTKMRLGLELNKEKDSAKYRRERRMLARMLSAIHIPKVKVAEESKVPPLKSKRTSRTLPASA